MNGIPSPRRPTSPRSILQLTPAFRSTISSPEPTRRTPPREIVAGYYENFDKSLTGPIDGMAEIVAELKAADVRLLGLSNWSAETIHHAPVVAPAISELEDIVVSGRVGLVKPDPAIFELTWDRFDSTRPGRSSSMICPPTWRQLNDSASSATCSQEPPHCARNCPNEVCSLNRVLTSRRPTNTPERVPRPLML